MASINHSIAFVIFARSSSPFFGREWKLHLHLRSSDQKAGRCRAEWDKNKAANCWNVVGHKKRSEVLGLCQVWHAVTIPLSLARIFPARESGKLVLSHVTRSLWFINKKSIFSNSPGETRQSWRLPKQPRRDEKSLSLRDWSNVSWRAVPEWCGSFLVGTASLGIRT